MKEKENNYSSKSIHIRLFAVIILIAVVIIASGLAAGAGFLSRSITRAIEDDMLVAVDIADLYVSNEIYILKTRAAEAAREINLLYASGEGGALTAEEALENVFANYPIFIGMGIYNENALAASWGNLSLPTDLYKEPFLHAAFSGGQAVSTTMRTLDGTLVMYISAPVNDNLVLAAVLPGIFLSELISGFTFWQTGHFFIDDKDGYVISTYRREWVEQRINFIEVAKTDSNYIEAAATIKRGIAGERGIGHFKMGGVPRICAFRPVSSTNEDWFLGIIAPLSETALQNIPAGVLITGVITMILSIFAAFIASGLLSRPYAEVDRLRRAAEIASVSKSTFLANMSHEIRTPMNSIVGFSELAMDDDIPLKTKDYLSRIQTNAEWLLQIINDILDISKIESGKMELEKIPFDIHELFTSCRTLVMPKAAEKGIMLHFYAEPSLGKKPLGDPTRLRQVFVNLLSNAVKFTNSGMVKLFSEIIDKTDTSITMRFEIKDSGIGMTEQQIKKIFDPFIQAETGTTRKYGGTGLGLSITKNIVEMMGGKLVVESTPGVGSKFSFDLKFDTIDITEEDLMERKIVLHELEKPTFEGEILLCEDNLMNQQVICEHLARVGLKTVVAENGKIGLDMVIDRRKKGEKQFDIIFMDMHMPVMDGIEASSRIFELDTGIPIIALTANVMSNDREVYKTNGIYDCLGKPFTSQELWRCLMRYFSPVNAIDTRKTEMVEADMEFQKKIQVLFAKNNQNKYEEIDKALKDNDIKLAHRLAHTLKGNAGQIGKLLLQKAAATVESELKDGVNNVTEDQLKVLEAELLMALQELSPVVEEAENKKREAAKTAADISTADIDFDELETMLNNGNPESLKYLTALRSKGGYTELAQQIEDFEFVKALATLLEIKGRTGNANG
jgi:signal transduction histidine kinase/DNA-binding response OmpR family regulator